MIVTISVIWGWLLAQTHFEATAYGDTDEGWHLYCNCLYRWLVTLYVCPAGILPHSEDIEWWEVVNAELFICNGGGLSVSQILPGKYVHAPAQSQPEDKWLTSFLGKHLPWGVWGVTKTHPKCTGEMISMKHLTKRRRKKTSRASQFRSVTCHTCTNQPLYFVLISQVHSSILMDKKSYY